MTHLLLAVGMAFGQQNPDMNVQMFHPTIDAERTLWTNDAMVSPDGYMQASTVVHFMKDPLVFVYPDGTEVSLLSSGLQADFVGAYTYDLFRFGLSVPVVLSSRGEDISGAGLGDLAFDLKGSILHPDEYPIGAAFLARLALPTGKELFGAPGVTWEVGFALDKRLGPALLAFNIANRGIPGSDLGNVTWNDALIVRAGGGLDITDELGLSLDFVSHLTYANPLSNPAGSPAEFMVGGWGRVSPNWVVRSGIGSGLNQGLGVPDVRALVSIEYAPPKIWDTDGDGLKDKFDACVNEPEDIDGYMDEDGCPDPSTAMEITIMDTSEVLVPAARLEVTVGDEVFLRAGSRVGMVLHPGRYPMTVQAPRYFPVEAEMVVPIAERERLIIELEPTFGLLEVRLEEPDGELVVGEVMVGEHRLSTVGGVASTELDPGTHAVVVHADGYKPLSREITIESGDDALLTLQLERARVVLTEDRIEIRETVYFEFGTSTIEDRSGPLLGDIAELLQEHPEIGRVRVEGHTDAQGGRASNQRLSQSRADSVVNHLVGLGIAAERLEAVGMGEEQILDSEDSEEAHARNRRVVFMILQRDEAILEGGEQ